MDDELAQWADRQVRQGGRRWTVVGAQEQHLIRRIVCGDLDSQLDRLRHLSGDRDDVPVSTDLIGLHLLAAVPERTAGACPSQQMHVTPGLTPAVYRDRGRIPLVAV